MMKQVICMKWGELYGSEYVNRLYAMVRHFTTGELRFICLTDDRSGIRSEVECYDCPEIPLPSRHRHGGYRKLNLFRSGEALYGLEGRFLFFDLDVMITSSIDDLFTFARDSSFVVMVNATERGKGIGNTSCFRLDIGSHIYIYDDLVSRQDVLLGEHANEQTYISRCISALEFFPESWCMLFKVHCVPVWPMRFWREPILPASAKVIAFPGKPNPPDAALGVWPVRAWHKRFYKYICPATWIEKIWRDCGA